MSPLFWHMEWSNEHNLFSAVIVSSERVFCKQGIPITLRVQQAQVLDAILITLKCMYFPLSDGRKKISRCTLRCQTCWKKQPRIRILKFQKWSMKLTCLVLKTSSIRFYFVCLTLLHWCPKSFLCSPVSRLGWKTLHSLHKMREISRSKSKLSRCYNLRVVVDRPFGPRTSSSAP